MCGIFGAVEWARPLREEDVLRATDSMQHRGPDESGFLFDHVPRLAASGRSCRFWREQVAGPWQLGFGHRRLSILDLASGQQPMADASGTWAITFNGEIYNHQELRSALAAEGATFLTDHSDTETLLLAFARWGPAVLPKLNSMCAAAIYHRESGRLWLVRDRFGKKPIYLLHGQNRLVFASELKAVIAYIGGSPPLDYDALGDYMMRGYIHEPRTIFRGVVKVPAATCVEFDLNALGGRLVAQQRYWDFRCPEARDQSRREEDWLAELEHLLDDAVKIRLLSDVPVGAFLSGGVDSATVCALASRHTKEPLRAFTIATDDPASNEAEDAAQVAARLGLRHVVEKCPLDPHSLLQEMVTTFDEPFSDLSMAPTFHVARLAAREVKVVLTGDGADEFFAGYSIFASMTTPRAWERVPGLDALAQTLLHRLPPTARGCAFLGRNFAGHGMARYQNIVGGANMLQLLDQDVARGIDSNWQRLGQLWRDSESFDEITRVSLLQGMTYLPDDILVKVDRATMAHALEARAPFLDYRVVEFAARIPPRLRLSNGQGKVILRRFAQRWFPPSYLNRPKRGFIIPLKAWMQHEMSEELDDLSRCSLFSRPLVTRLVSLQRRTGRDYSSPLWRLMILNRWLKQWQPASQR
jgi:asparagine synthase (glutamine-hydrolysing)